MGNFEGKMKWHKFLAYFLLWVSAIMNFASYAAMKSGAQYGPNKDRVYEVFPEIKSVDGTFAVICLIMAIVAIFAAIGLLKFKKFGPVLVIVLYALNGIGSAYYSSQIVKAVEEVKDIVDLSQLKSQYTLQVVGAIVLVVLNFIYFNKRKSLYN